MPERSYPRLAVYAALALLHAAVVAALVVAPVEPAATGWIVLITSVPLLLAWGPFQADVAFNASLDERSRARWRIAIYLAPWVVAAYWLVHIRTRPRLVDEPR